MASDVQIPNCNGGSIHVAFLAAYVEAARGVGLEPYRQLRQARLPDAGFDELDLTISYGRFHALLARSAEVAGCEDFTLRLLEAVNPFLLGNGGALAAVQPTVGLMLTTLCGANLIEGVRMTSSRKDANAVLRFESLPGSVSVPPHRTQLLLGVALRATQAALGSHWRPRDVALSGETPSNPAPFATMFGDVSFKQPFDTITMAAEDLDRSNPGANAVLARLAASPGSASSGSLDKEMRAIIGALLPRGQCSIQRAALLLGVHRRTVHRRLRENGASFGELVQSVRVGVVERALGEAAHPVSALAGLAGFASVSAFSRWFTRTHGRCLRQFRL